MSFKIVQDIDPEPQGIMTNTETENMLANQSLHTSLQTKMTQGL